MSDRPEKNTAQMDKAIDKMFEQYPPITEVGRSVMDTSWLSFEEQWCQQADLLINELSAALITLPGDDVGVALHAAQQQIGEAIAVDRSTLIEFTGETVRAAQHWANDDVPQVDCDDHAQRLAWLLDQVGTDNGVAVLEQIPQGLPHQAATPAMLDHVRQTGLRAAVIIPIAIGGQRAYALAVELVRAERRWPPALVARLRLVAEILASAAYRSRQEEALRYSHAEVARLTAELATDATPPTPTRTTEAGFDEIIGNSPALRAALDRVKEVAPTHSTVLLLGETGTGKELIARALHRQGPRQGSALVSVNCAALPPTLIESELFGHERGAFTGAVAMRPGRFQLAHNGTLFLDEIGDLPLDLQSKLLRVLQEGEFERIGSSHTQKVNVRIVAATHKDLARSVANGEFRDDLYYRLSVFPIRLPPLRERREDIPALVWFVIQKRQRAMHRWIKVVPDGIMAALQNYSWPGNVRELENVIERALIHSPGHTLRLLDDALEAPASRPPEDLNTLSAVERTHIEGVLRDCRWRINGAGNAAERLGLHPNTLRFRMKKLGIVRNNAASQNGDASCRTPTALSSTSRPTRDSRMPGPTSWP